MNKPTIQFPSLLQWQQTVYDSTARFKVLAVGRRSGKTYLGVILSLITAFYSGSVLWLAPSHNQALIGWNLIKNITAQMNKAVQAYGTPALFTIKESERKLEVSNGGFIHCRTADNPDLLRGESYHLAVLDECSFIKKDTWEEAIRPTLTDKQGKALFISTPKGKNWFYKLFLRGKSEDYPEWESWQLTSFVNPLLPEGEIEAAKLDMPLVKYQQEYLAEFVDDSFAVFKNFRKCITTHQTDPLPQHQYLMGVDWGKLNDYSVFTVLDVTEDIPSLVHIRRINQHDYQFQLKILQEIYNNYHPHTILAERNSIGEVLLEQLQRENLPVKPFTTTNASKIRIIESLALAFEQEKIAIYDFPHLIEELEVYEFQRTKTGLTTFNAPNGFNDDAVISLALAYAAAKRIETLPLLPLNFREFIGV